MGSSFGDLYRILLLSIKIFRSNRANCFIGGHNSSLCIFLAVHVVDRSLVPIDSSLCFIGLFSGFLLRVVDAFNVVRETRRQINLNLKEVLMKNKLLNGRFGFS